MKRVQESELTHEEGFAAYFEIVKTIYERMRRENPWPWVVDPEGWEKTHSGLRPNTDPPLED